MYDYVRRILCLYASAHSYTFCFKTKCTSCLFSKAELQLSWLRLPLDSRLSCWHTWRFEPRQLYVQARDASDGDVTSKLLMSVTHIQMRIMKPTHECRHHGRATTSAPPLVLISAYISLEIQRSSTTAAHRRRMSVWPRGDYTKLLSDDISCIFCHPNPISCWVRLRLFAAVTPDLPD